MIKETTKMINVMISNANNEYLEYQYRAESGAETPEAAITFALEEYIKNKLDGFESALFPIAEDLWMTKIKTAVVSNAINIQDKIKLLNSICRKSSFKIDKVFVGYTVKYPPVMLPAPVVAISAESGAVCWPAVENATGYEYFIDDGEAVNVGTATSVRANTFTEGQTVSVKALGNNAEYLDSAYAKIVYSYASN
jgi:hypothetical protein